MNTFHINSPPIVKNITCCKNEFKKSPLSQFYFIQELDKDIAQIDRFILSLNAQNRKLIASCLLTSQSRVCASLDNVKALHQRFKETTTLLFRESKLSDCSDRRESDAVTLLARPEHFHHRIGPTHNSKYKAARNSNSSPWTGSDYKLSLLASLRIKLLLKTIIHSLAHNSHCEYIY